MWKELDTTEIQDLIALWQSQEKLPFRFPPRVWVKGWRGIGDWDALCSSTVTVPTLNFLVVGPWKEGQPLRRVPLIASGDSPEEAMAKADRKMLGS